MAIEQPHNTLKIYEEKQENTRIIIRIAKDKTEKIKQTNIKSRNTFILWKLYAG